MRNFARAFVALLIGVQALATPASANPKDLAAFARMAGEIGVARSNCGFDMDTTALLALGRPFALHTADAAAQEKGATLIAAELARASQQYHAIGGERFCRDMLAAYGPAGRVVMGILKPR